MHSGLHTLAHRAPGGARSRVRWQPYAQLQASVQSSVSSSSITSRSSPTNYLNTPSSVSSSSPYSTPATSYCDRPKLLPTPSTSTATKEPTSKKNALGLVDQAVKTICDIWRSEEIPTVFQTADRATLAQLTIKTPSSVSTTELVAKTRRNIQLPSPVSPKTQPSPPEADPSPASTIEIEPTCMFGSKTNLIPIKGFVHEVLRRSRTSGLVLQTALCYLEAIRHRLPGLRQQGVLLEPDIDIRITLATLEELEQDQNDSTYFDDGMDTIRVNDAGSASISLESIESMPEGDTLKKPKGPSPPMAPLPPLPSPLLCPRRAFLAALILASKFTQDKCYSNRAWAKLSGLPAREISRCERALGDALDWRLWVGKSAASPPQATRPVTRCRSESDLRAERISSFLVSREDLSTAKSTRETAVQLPPTPALCSSRPALSGLRRASTLPTDAFSSQQPTPAPPEQIFVDSVDQYMASPDHLASATCTTMESQVFDSSAERSSIEYPPTEVIHPVENFTSPPTPPLTYSPSSTESSSGDRTIQMSTFDEPTPGLPGSDTWSWSDTSPPHLRELGTMTMYDADPHGSTFSHQFAIPVHSDSSFAMGLVEPKVPPNLQKIGVPPIHLVPPDGVPRFIFDHA